MSQYVFRHGTMKVLYGWDDPLRYFFLVITEVDAKGKESRGVFSNLDLPNPAMTIDQIKKTLGEYAIEVPASLEDDLRRDELHGHLTYADSPLQSMMRSILSKKK